jgi:hypothetical protein
MQINKLKALFSSPGVYAWDVKNNITLFFSCQPRSRGSCLFVTSRQSQPLRQRFAKHQPLLASVQTAAAVHQFYKMIRRLCAT